MKQLHTIQLKILKDLLFSQALRYSEMRPLAMENSQFVFHLDQLTHEGYIEKLESSYILTDKGKEFANKMEENDNVIAFQAKITTVLCIVKDVSGSRSFLIYRRLKNPFYGCQGFPTEKVQWGEAISEAAERGIQEETGLQSEATLFAIRHYRVLSKGEMVEDKLMHAFFFKNPKGELRGNIEGEYAWVKESDLKEYVTNPLEEFWEFYNAFKKFTGEISFAESETLTTKF